MYTEELMKRENIKQGFEHESKRKMLNSDTEINMGKSGIGEMSHRRE
jgi:hypothetical protein